MKRFTGEIPTADELASAINAYMKEKRFLVTAENND